MYEEPDGEFLEFIESGNNTITVLTRVEQVEPLLDPANYSVSDLKKELQGQDLGDEYIDALIEAEESDKGRKTAIGFFEEIKQG